LDLKNLQNKVKICRKCGIEKDESCFYKRKCDKYGKERLHSNCKDCIIKCQVTYYQENKETIIVRKKKHYQKNREKFLLKKSEYYQENKTRILQGVKDYAKNNVEKIKIRKNKYRKNRRLNDYNFRIRTTISTHIGLCLKLNGSSKVGKSCMKYLSYSIQELNDHLTLLFSHPDNLTDDGQVWMTWSNWGKYDPTTWNDNDPTTWKWQIDHIIPKSTFHYASMEDQSFKDCWALNNLRPFGAKQNLLDGARKIRH
jgi:hypothetical protein